MTVDHRSLMHMLNLALATSLNHYKFYLDAANEATEPKIKALLMVLSESEEQLAAEIERMIAEGIAGPVQEAVRYADETPPDETPFDLHRAETDPRLFICNTALEMELKGYTFYLSIATRAKSEVIHRLFLYFAHLKAEQIKKLRRVCQTF